MKYIKVFEDFNSTGTKKLREFTEDYLAYLLDDQDVKIQIELGNEEGSYGLMIHKYAYGMDWLSIKDHFIPFLSMLIKDYDVFNTSIGLTKNGHWIPGKVYSVDEIINDKVSIDGKISNISIDLKEKE
jgi:hypothetical protein